MAHSEPERVPLKRLVTLALLAVGALGLTLAEAAAKREPDCNRRCLLEVLQTYTEGLLDNGTSCIRVGSGLRVTSNGVDVQLGKGELRGLASHSRCSIFRWADPPQRGDVPRRQLYEDLHLAGAAAGSCGEGDLRI